MLGILLLLATEILRVYFIMPFPGSQQSETITLAYWIHSSIWLLRILGLGIIAYPVYSLFRLPKMIGAKSTVIVCLLLYVGIAYLLNFKMLAEKMFYQPETKILADASHNSMPPETVVIGVMLNGEARAYPLEFIGYHHQVRDTVGGEPVMITYCTVCRTGRVWSPMVNGKNEEFRLVGMDHFNAMFEDATTGSWWRQVNGEAITGKLKGTMLREFPAEQTTLKEWMAHYPKTLVMQPDTKFTEEYQALNGYARGKSRSKLTGTSVDSWKPKSWVIGITAGKDARAYDWNKLLAMKIINDTLAGAPIAVTIGADSVSFHAFRRMVGSNVLTLTADSTGSTYIDSQTQSVWNPRGECIDGTLKGTKLERMQAYQEFWHSWQTFHPETTQFH